MESAINFFNFIYLNKFNIIIPQNMYRYSCTVPPNGYYLHLSGFINVLIVIIIDT